jgi:hypothetical protein
MATFFDLVRSSSGQSLKICSLNAASNSRIPILCRESGCYIKLNFKIIEMVMAVGCRCLQVSCTVDRMRAVRSNFDGAAVRFMCRRCLLVSGFTVVVVVLLLC